MDWQVDYTKETLRMADEQQTTVSVGWDEDHPMVIRYTMQSHWELDDLYNALTQGFAMQQQKEDQTVHLVFDTQLSDMVPNGIVSAASYIQRNCPSNTGKFFVLTTSRMIRGITNLVNRVLPQQEYIVVRSEEELQQHLR